jgi:hypothetical protein
MCPVQEKSSDVLFGKMIESLREYGLPAMRRIIAAEDIADRLAPMGLFRGWAEHFPKLLLISPLS